MKKTTISKAYSKLNPESCVFVLSIDEKDKPNGMVCSWHMKCSEEPPLFAVSIWKKGNTQKLIRKSKEFVIAAANEKLLDAVKVFGYASGKSIDKFEKTKIMTGKSELIKTPIIKDATVNFECKLYKTVDAGECYIFIGKILKAYINENEKILFAYPEINGKREFKYL